MVKCPALIFHALVTFGQQQTTPYSTDIMQFIVLFFKYLPVGHTLYTHEYCFTLCLFQRVFQAKFCQNWKQLNSVLSFPIGRGLCQESILGT